MFEDLISAAAIKHNIPRETLTALVKRESNFDPNAIGDKGLAIGLCQMHPVACAEVGANWNDMYDPAKALDAGAAYLKKMLDRAEGDMLWALAAYNQGPTVIFRARRYAQAVIRLVE